MPSDSNYTPSRNRARSLLAAALALAASTASAGDADPLPGEYVAPGWRYARSLLNPASPAPSAIARDGTVESATASAGSTRASGAIALMQWSGDNQGGGRSFAGNSLVADPGTNYFIAMQPWAIQEDNDAYGFWHIGPKFGQNAVLIIGWSGGTAASLPMTSGTGAGVSSGGPAVCLVLPYSMVQGGFASFQMTYYAGNPYEAGIWQIPAGQSLMTAQKTVGNKLSDLDPILREVPPDAHQTAFKLQVGADGRWVLSVDIGRDGVVDVDATSEQTGNKPSTLSGLGETSGVFVQTLAAGGSGTGKVGRSPLTINYVESPTAPVVARDRRPFSATIPTTSVVSPATIPGKRWSTASTITATADTLPGGSAAARYFGSADFLVDLPLKPDATPTPVTLAQSGTPPTTLAGAVAWQPTDLVNHQDITIRAGDALLFACTDYNDLAASMTIDANGDGVVDFTGTRGALFPYRYTTPGTYTATGRLDGAVAGSATIHVVSVAWPKAVACQVGFTRTVDVDLGSAASNIVFTSNDTTLMTVSEASRSGGLVRLNVKTLKRGTPVLQARLGSSSGAIVSTKEVDEFTVDAPGNKGILVSGKNGIGRSKIIIRPYVPDLDLQFKMKAGTASFKGGTGSFSVSTSGAKSSNGEPEFIIKTDAATNEQICIFKFDFELPADETKYCFNIGISQNGQIGNQGLSRAGYNPRSFAPLPLSAMELIRQYCMAGMGSPTMVGSSGGNGDTCKVTSYNTLIFTKAVDIKEDEILKTNNPEVWSSREWTLLLDDKCTKSSGGTGSCTPIEYFVSVPPPNGTADIDPPKRQALFLRNSTDSDCLSCLNINCRSVTPLLDTGTIPAEYNTTIYECISATDSKDELGECEGGTFVISKLDASGPRTGQRDHFPEFTGVMKKRHGYVSDPVIQMESGGDGAVSGCSLYGTFDCPKQNVWVFTAIAKHPKTKVNIPKGVRIEWDTDGGAKEVLAMANGQELTIKVEYPVGSHKPKLRIYYKDPCDANAQERQVGEAQIHTIQVESKYSSNVNPNGGLVSDPIGARIDLTNEDNAYQPVDARVGIVAATSDIRGRVSPDGYPQNEYWVKADDKSDLPQTVRAEDGVSLRLFIQGYNKPSESLRDLTLLVEGQALIEDCRQCANIPWGSTPVRLEYQDTDREKFASIAIDQLVDANRDHVITDSEEDSTSIINPYKFWLNNDHDDLEVMDDTFVDRWILQGPFTEETDAVAGPEDCSDSLITTRRDLEDLTRWWMRVHRPTDGSPDAQELKVEVKFDNVVNAPQLNLFRAVEKTGGIQYLTDYAGVAKDQINDWPVSIVRGVNNQWKQIESNYIVLGFDKDGWRVSPFIYEASARGIGKLWVRGSMIQNGMREILTQEFNYFEFKPVDEMFEKYSAGEASAEGATQEPSAIATRQGAFAYQEPTVDCPLDDPTYLIYVHGWNMSPSDKKAFSETAYKRLWWNGYRGQFGFFSWPTGTGSGLTYDPSEFTAWKTGGAFAAFIHSVKSKFNGEIHVLGHSMGNIVIGSGFKQDPSSAGLCATYVASQSAPCAQVYDGINISRPIDFLGGVMGPNTANVYPDFLASVKGLVRIINFYNTNDYALSQLVTGTNQSLKPDVGYDYNIIQEHIFPAVDTINAGETEFHDRFYRSGLFRRTVVPWNTSPVRLASLYGLFDVVDSANVTRNKWEIMSFMSEARVMPMGATPGIPGIGQSNLQLVWPILKPDNTPSGGLPYSTHRWHSAQFLMTNMEQYRYWKLLITSCAITSSGLLP